MSLRAEIFKTPLFKGCAAGGISEHNDAVTLVNVSGPVLATEDAPAVMLVAGHTPGTVRIVPAVQDDKSSHYYADLRRLMFGGAYVATSDSRFTEAVENLTGARFYGAVALHDRFES